MQIWKHLVFVIFLIFSSLHVAAQTVESDTSEPAKKDERLSPEDIEFENRDLTYYGAKGVPIGPMQLGYQSNYYSPHVFIVDKKERVLSIWEETAMGLQRIAAYPTDIGKNVKDKQILGDKATPEGIYFMLEKYEANSLDYQTYGSRAFTLDYPNFFDRMEKKTGSGIWLHAVPDTVSLRRGSRGCVILRDQIIKSLHPYFRPGFTPVIIQEKVEFFSPAAREARRKEILAWVEDWRAAWQGKNIENYIEYYHPEFRNMKMDRERWKKYKETLAANYQTIQVQISNPVVYQAEDEMIVRFVQSYSSDQHQDLGEKTLYFRKHEGQFKIVGEEWKKDESPLAQNELSRSFQARWTPEVREPANSKVKN